MILKCCVCGLILRKRSHLLLLQLEAQVVTLRSELKHFGVHLLMAFSQAMQCSSRVICLSQGTVPCFLQISTLGLPLSCLVPISGGSGLQPAHISSIS
jgi:hypothetical protein